MSDNIPHESMFPVGYHKIHKNRLFNFQLNRWFSFGQARLHDLKAAAAHIRTYDDWKHQMIRIAESAKHEGRLVNAGIYYRAAEFFSDPSDPDREGLIDAFLDLFYKGYGDEDIERVSVPYQDSFLPAIRIGPIGEHLGTVVMHGGMDSYLEEWYLMMRYFAAHGFEVIGFDGPGQGCALIKGGIPMDICWEKPVAAIMDHFNCDNVTLFGFSVGGWLALRAAAFEHRIARVITSGHALHYMDIPPRPIAWIFEYFMRFENLFNRSAYWKMAKNPRMKWEIGQTMHITQSTTPFEAAEKFNIALSRTNMYADQVLQDVFVISGQDDHFIPVRLHQHQLSALTNAQSVTARVFTRSESAQNHCQIGNIGLALDAMIDWICRKTGPHVALDLEV